MQIDKWLIASFFLFVYSCNSTQKLDVEALKIELDSIGQADQRYRAEISSVFHEQGGNSPKMKRIVVPSK